MVWFDLGGSCCGKRLWRDYVSPRLDAVVFVVDAADPSRLEEAREELVKALHIIQEQAEHVSVLLLGNKIDRPEALSKQALSDALQLETKSRIAGYDDVTWEHVRVLHLGCTNPNSPWHSTPPGVLGYILRFVGPVRRERPFAHLTVSQLYMCSTLKVPAVDPDEGLWWLCEDVKTHSGRHNSPLARLHRLCWPRSLVGW